MDDLKAAVKADRIASYVRLKGGFSVALAGAVYWGVLAWIGYTRGFGIWITAAMWGSGLIFPLALLFAWLFRNNFMRDRTSVGDVLLPTFISMLLFWPILASALWTAPALTSLILAIGLSLHWPVIGWAYGRTGLYTTHAIVRAAVVFFIWNWMPDARLSLIPLAVCLIYLVTIVAILADVRSTSRAIASRPVSDRST